MIDKEALSHKLLELLAEIGFAKKYYAFYEKARDRTGPSGCGVDDFRAVVTATSLDFNYNKKERFFRHEEIHEHCELSLTVALLYSSNVELILAVKTKYGYIGGPVTGLANDIEQLRDLEFEYKPAYPTLPFSNREELEEAVNFGISLFREAKEAILAYEDWDA